MVIVRTLAVYMRLLHLAMDLIYLVVLYSGVKSTVSSSEIKSLMLQIEKLERDSPDISPARLY